MRRQLRDVVAERAVVLDGGLATLLESHGHDLSDQLWSARLLRDDPAAVVAAHREFFEAGAEVAISASYQVSEHGLGDRADELLRESVRLAARARDEVAPDGWVAASVGPYGAVLADGSEYRGVYDLDAAGLREFHRPRLQTLLDAGADVLALETIPCLAEVEVLLGEIAGTGHPAWLSLTVAGGRTRAGESLDEAFAMAADVEEVLAVGINCSAPAEVTSLGRAVVAYPNSGQGWDAERREWTGEPAFDADDVAAWLAAGTRLVGGCCGVGPADISATARAVAAIR